MVVTLCTQDDVKDRAGVNANATILASSTILDRYINNSEGVVIGETGMDWIAADSALTNTYIKLLLASCVASHASRNIIEYDMSGFTSRAEAITMLNVLENEFRRSLNKLQEFALNKTIRTVPT